LGDLSDEFIQGLALSRSPILFALIFLIKNEPSEVYTQQVYGRRLKWLLAGVGLDKTRRITRSTSRDPPREDYKLKEENDRYYLGKSTPGTWEYTSFNKGGLNSNVRNNSTGTVA
jgi:hypothetical protein